MRDSRDILEFDETGLIVTGCKDDGITEIIIPEGVTDIGNYAFMHLINLSYVLIPDSVKKIGKHVFYGCSCLKSVTIPKNVRYIEDYSFCGCDSLKFIDVEKNNHYYADIDGVLFNKNKTLLLCFPKGKEEKKYEIPKSVINIADGAFNECSNLEIIEIPNSVRTIGNDAFYGCI